MNPDSLKAQSRPRIVSGPAGTLSLGDRFGFWIGTVGGIGLIRPAPGTWGSIPGFLFFLWWRTLPGPWVAWCVEAAAVLLSVWSAGRCERILGQKDPSSVVIDEAVCVPLALWPLVGHPGLPWWIWGLLFAAYRLFDIVKPYPVRRFEAIGGGWGITLDDCASSAMLGVLVFLWLRF